MTTRVSQITGMRSSRSAIALLPVQRTLERLDVAQSLCDDLAAARKPRCDLASIEPRRVAELGRAGDLIAVPRDELVEEVIERMHVVLGEAIEVEPREHAVKPAALVV